MTSPQTAAATMEALIAGQEKAKARIYGSVEEIPERFRASIVGTTTLRQSPELAEIAPHAGEFTAYGFSVTRREVDELVNFYVRRLS